MATIGVGIRDSFKAAVDMDSYQYHFVKAGSVAGEVSLGTGGSLPGTLGIIENDPAPLEEASVCLFGVSKVAASGALMSGAASAIGVGDYLVCGSDAHARRASGSVANAVALEALASGTGGTIRVLVLPPGMTVIGIN